MSSEFAKPLVTAAIYLLGYELDPERVSRVLGVQPSASQKKGGFKFGSGRHTAKTGMWALIIESDSRPAAEMVDELFQKLEKAIRRLDKIEGVQNAHLDIFFAVDDHPGCKHTVEFKLNRKQLLRLNQLGLSVYITVM